MERNFLTSNESKILDALKKSSGSVKSSYLHLVTEITKSELNRALNSLIVSGYIVREGRHVHTTYKLKPRGIPKAKVKTRLVTNKEMMILDSRPKKIQGKTKAEFIEWLEEVLIPDLKESGSDPTAETFETCIKWMNQ